jgi:aminoglycoside 6'-N-acetyltransferase
VPADPAISFRPLDRADLPRLRDWLNTPHVYRWWGTESGPGALGGPGLDAATIEEVEAKYQATIDTPGTTRRFVIQVDERPVGLIQCYRLADEPEYALEISEDTATAASVDLLIGEPELVGRGIGGYILDTFVRTIVFADDGVTRAVAGPDVRNVRSIRAFEKAGFRAVRDALITGEPHPERVMVRDRG